MTTLIPRGAPRARRVSDSSHLYVVGQAVRLKSDVTQATRTPGVYLVTATFPPLGARFQYRIRSQGEGHERMTTQDDIEPATLASPGPGAALAERTFTRG